MTIRKITIYEVKQIIKESKNNSPGESGYKKELLINVPDSAIEYLIDIFNAALSAGYFPDKFKSSIVKFIPKEGKVPNEPTGVRPISLLETPGKILERIIIIILILLLLLLLFFLERIIKKEEEQQQQQLL